MAIHKLTTVLKFIVNDGFYFKTRFSGLTACRVGYRNVV